MGSGGAKCIGVIVGIVVVLIIIIALVASSLKKLASNEVGLEYDTIWRSLDKNPKREGLHTGPPGFEFKIFPSTYTTLSYNNLQCINHDGVKIRLNVAYQYKARVSGLYKIIMQFEDKDGYERILRLVGSSALHESCSQFNTSQFQAQRAEFQSTVRTVIQKRYAELHADITDLQVSNIIRPSQYENAIKSKERAKEDIQVARKERPRVVKEAETKLREANTTAQIIIDKALSEARILENQAISEGEAIKQQYEKEVEAYEVILKSSGLGFTQEGFISYLGVRVISSAKNPVYIGMDSPAKSSYVQK